MLTIKQYANGRLYDTLNKEYLTKEKVAEMARKNKKMKIVQSKSGKDVTKSVLKELTAKKTAKKNPGLSPEKMKKWVQERVDKQLNSLLDMVNLPSSDQIETLKKGLKQLTQKVNELEKLQAKRIADMQKKQARHLARMEKDYEERIDQLEEQLTEQVDAQPQKAPESQTTE